MSDEHQIAAIIATAILDSFSDLVEHKIDSEQAKIVAKRILTVLSDAGLQVTVKPRMGSDYAKLLQDSANVLDNVRGNLSDLFKAQPLALGAIGLAIGAGIAAALPHTDIENSNLGETSDSLKSKAASWPVNRSIKPPRLRRT